MPVVASVEDLVAGGRLGVAGLLVGLGQGEVGASSDNVNMRRNLSRVDNRVATLDGQRRTVDCEELSIGSLKEGRRNSGSNGEAGRHDECIERDEIAQGFGVGCNDLGSRKQIPWSERPGTLLFILMERHSLMLLQAVMMNDSPRYDSNHVVEYGPIILDYKSNCRSSFLEK